MGGASSTENTAFNPSEYTSIPISAENTQRYGDIKANFLSFNRHIPKKLHEKQHILIIFPNIFNKKTGLCSQRR